jgi:hypothetical protein
MKTKGLLALSFIVIFIVSNCKKDAEKEKVHCGNGSGDIVAFCDQVEHYDAGYGVPVLDVINVTCLVGPVGATVSNQTNGTYYCSGTYKLTSFDDAEISIGWGGTTYFDSAPIGYQITKGQGTFNLAITKKSGGSGNIFLSMSSGSMWMFDVVLINICTPKKSAEIKLYKIDKNNNIKENDKVKTIPYEYR